MTLITRFRDWKAGEPRHLPQLIPNLEAVTNEADIKIGGDGLKDNETKWEDREGVVDKLKDSTVDELKDGTSDIYLLLSAAGSSQANKARHILKKYAPGQQTKKNFVNSISNLNCNFENNKGRFSLSNTTDNKLEWNNSKARDLLYKLCLHRFKGVGAMASKDIYKYHPVFAQYDLGDFKKRDEEMIILTSNVIQYTCMIQTLCKKKVQWEFDNDESSYFFTVDTGEQCW